MQAVWLSIQRNHPLDFIRPFLAMTMPEQAHHCSSGLTKPFADERVLLWSLMRGGCSVHPINKGIFSRKRLQERMQSFARTNAKLCVGRCKALRGRMQSFASEMGKTGTEIVSPILDKRKGRN